LKTNRRVTAINISKKYKPMPDNNNDIEEISILFVATGPLSKRLEPYVDVESLNDLKQSLTNRGCPPQVYEFIIQNKLIFYCQDNEDQNEDEDDDNEVLMFQPNDLPDVYWKYFVMAEESFDLDKYRDKIYWTIKHNFPKVKTVKYYTVDWQILPPSLSGTINKVIENDAKFSNLVDTKFMFRDHYQRRFQDLIKDRDSKYNVIWFLGCCTPSYFISKTKSYINNFRNSLCEDGFIFHMDPVNGPVLDLVDMEKRQEHINPNEIERVKYLTRHLVQIQPGVYKFN